MGISGLKKLRRQINHIDNNLQDNVEDAVERGAEGVVNTAKHKVAQQQAIWRGNLYNSIDVREEGASRFVITADVPYAAYVEFGTGVSGDPTAPPKFTFKSPDEEDFSDVFPHIRNWMNTKPFWSGPRDTGSAIAITHSIIDTGTEAQPFMRPAWFRGKPKLIERTERAVRKTISRV